MLIFSIHISLIKDLVFEYISLEHLHNEHFIFIV